MKRSLFSNVAFGTVLIFALLAYPVTDCFSEHAHDVPQSQQRFDDIGFWVKAFEDPEREKWQKPDEVIKNMNIKPGDVIADIGAGTGYFTRHFAQAVGPEGKALGLDIEPAMVKYMSEDARKLKLNNYIARVVKPDNPGLEPESVDIIFICDTYHHIENRVEYLKNLSKSLKTNGRIIIVDFYKKPFPNTPPVEHKISEKTVIEEFWQAGYNLKRMLDFLPAQYFLEFGL